MPNKVRRRVWAVMLVFLLGVVCAASAAGRTIKVPLDFTKIQDAIDDANDGDMILVADSTYKGDGNRDIDFKGKAIAVRSEHGPENCIIDCQATASEHHLGFIFHNAEGPNSVLDGFTITNGYHDDAGAILCMYVSPRPSSPTITNCVITNNHGMLAGAIHCTSRCEPLISNCVISDNTGFYTGGISYADECRPVVSNCIITGNSGSSGGGIRTGGARCHGTISNCLISSNTATGRGAGVDWWSYGGSVEIKNCTIVGNEDHFWTGGIVIGGGGGTTGTITNCIVWGNTVWDLPHAQIYLWSDGDSPTTAEVTYCDIQGGWGGEGNIDDDPLFVDADRADDLHLLGGSPCLDEGDNSAIPVWMTTDVEGNPRIVNGTVDMGAYEGPHQGLLLSKRSVVVPEGQTAAFTVALAMEPLGTVEVAVAVESGDPDITVQSGAVLTFNSSNYSQPKTVILAAAEDNDHVEGTAAVSVSASGFSTLDLSVTEDENDDILYVDADAKGAGTGFNWADAFTSLQDALAAARTNPPITEIRVAQGIYKPDNGAEQTPGGRDASFELVNGVALKGGYAGWGEIDPDERDIAGYETILSGDLNGDDEVVGDVCDLLTEPTRAENSFHVVVGSCDFPDCEPDSNTSFDGFTVTVGNGPSGGGMYYSHYKTTIANCTFTGNSATEGGGGIWGSGGLVVNCLITRNAVYWHGGGLAQCSGLVKDCIISRNYAAHRGGGYEMWEGDTHFDNCTFSDNSAGSDGGAMFFADAAPRLSDCTFSGNIAHESGGGVYSAYFDYASTPVLINCNFSQNTASEAGGGMCNAGSHSRLTNCIFSGNSAEYGGGMANFYNSKLRLFNCTFAGNSAPNGNALSCDSYNTQYPYPSNLQLTNCILWDGGDEVFSHDNSEIQITYSDVEGGWGGEGNGNIDAEPCFAEEGYWDANETPEDANDDYWIDGDYHLRSLAGRWEPSAQNWVQDDVTSPCIDAGDPKAPIGPEPFPNGGIINMGAYGGTAQSSKSHFGKPVCEIIVAGDINGDCIVNFKDLAFIALHWLEEHNP